MAEQVEMSFKNKELKMWFMIMVPVIIIGTIALFINDGTTSWLQFIILFTGLVSYYTWRFQYRKKKKKTDAKK
ncbi:hypothetical protein [Planococcus salinarum]|uniref:hypothetical protein n=1 Tax=Planococcus salinarum TaxID=622695 RepID=UPI000E3C8A63|nr:hypothetical protein [Planococcus salinarum]TAA71707.1 hypothetical protein D2909_10295 [Planococcus salinarum]